MLARSRQKQEAAIKLRQAGKSYRLIGAWLGVGHATVIRWAKNDEQRSTGSHGTVEQVESADGKMRPSTLASAPAITERAQRIQSAHDSGLTIREIAKQEGVSVGTVHADLKREIPEQADGPDEFEELTQPPAVDMRVFELIEYAARSMSVEDTHNIRTLRVDSKLVSVEYISAKRMKKTADSTVGGRLYVRFAY